MRKFKGLLCSISMAAVMLMSGFAVCAEEAETAEAAVTASAVITADDGISETDQQALASYAQSSIEMVAAMSDAEIQEQIHPTTILAVVEDSVVSSLQSWLDMKAELGAYVATKSHDITLTDDEIIIKTTCAFENMEGIVTTTLSRDDLSMDGMLFAAGDVSMGAKMKEAALNTIMGLGIVFLVLLFLSFLIGQFKHVSKLENALAGKKAAPAPTPAPAAAPAAPATVEEEVADDGELIAVIAAAIAAAEGTSADGFVVRSIKKHNRKKWQNA